MKYSIYNGQTTNKFISYFIFKFFYFVILVKPTNKFMLTSLKTTQVNILSFNRLLELFKLS